jgi:hypothetical protein
MNIVWMYGCTTDCWRKVSIKEIKCNKQKSNRVVKKTISDRDIGKLSAMMCIERMKRSQNFTKKKRGNISICCSISTERGREKKNKERDI